MYIYIYMCIYICIYMYIIIYIQYNIHNTFYESLGGPWPVNVSRALVRCSVGTVKQVFEVTGAHVIAEHCLSLSTFDFQSSDERQQGEVYTRSWKTPAHWVAPIQSQLTLKIPKFSSQNSTLLDALTYVAFPS